MKGDLEYHHKAGLLTPSYLNVGSVHVLHAATYALLDYHNIRSRIWESPKIMGASFWGPCWDPTI